MQTNLKNEVETQKPTTIRVIRLDEHCCPGPIAPWLI